MIIRLAVATDAKDMTTLLNAIIAQGGSTAHQRPFDTARMTAHYIAPSALISCHVAEENQKVLGFQSLAWADNNNDDPMPKGWAIIASFVANHAAGKGVGNALFQATKLAANTAKVVAIDATIRADNTAGLRYYSRLGFVDYDRLTGIPLRDGTPIDRVRKRFDLS